jgi:glycosyltransferase involved in cell wall biosynthesis
LNDLLNYAISVVITAYNAEYWIAETLESVLSQTCPPLEIIVVDDGSTDETTAILHAYAGRVRLLQQEHQGPAVARNLGIREAIGKYIAFVDSDDLWKPDKLALQIEKLRQGYDWVISDYRCFDDVTRQTVLLPKPRFYEGDVLEHLFLVNFIGSPTPVVLREIFADVGLLNTSPLTRIGEDWEMWLRIAAKYPLGVVREELAELRLHASSTMASTAVETKLENLTYIIETTASREPTRLLKLKPRAIANLHYGFGVSLFKANQYTEARSQFMEVLRAYPFHLEAMTYLVMTILGPGFSKPIIRMKKHLFSLFSGGSNKS